MFSVGRYRGDASPATTSIVKAEKGCEQGKGRQKREREGGKGNVNTKQARPTGKFEHGKGVPHARSNGKAKDSSELTESVAPVPAVETKATETVVTTLFANMKAAAAKTAQEAAAKAELKSRKKKGKINKVRRVPIEAILGSFNDEKGVAGDESVGNAGTKSSTQNDSNNAATLQETELTTSIDATMVGAGDSTTELSVPSVAEDAHAWGVDARLLAALQQQGVERFFPVQRQVIPETLAASRRHVLCARDVCVGAATGSGKTLVFVVTVLQALLGRKVPHIRALVVLPSRSLALQVFEEFQKYAPSVGLRVGLATGQRDFAHEQEELTGVRPDHPILPTSLPRPPWSSNGGGGSNGSGGGKGCVDIVVCTPGRLVDHLEHTPGITLEHLRFLVVDEADRLLNQSYNAWVEKVLAAAYRQVPGTADFVANLPRGGGSKSGSNDGSGWHLDLKPTTARAHLGAAMDSKDTTAAGAGAAGLLSGSQQQPSTSQQSMTVVPVPMLRMLFSATLSENPQKLAALGLINPKFYALANNKEGKGADNQTNSKDDDDNDATAMVLPATLTELVLKVSAGSAATVTKPLLLLALLRRILEASPHSFVLVFASSLDSTHRLARLLQLALDNGSSTVFEYSGGVSSLSPVQAQQQKLARNGFKTSAPPSTSRQVRVVVCSDGLARGVDLPGVSHVLNYDAPTSIQAYVHRVGRTARAGRKGTAVTLVKGGQDSAFRELRAQLTGGTPSSSTSSSSSSTSTSSPSSSSSSGGAVAELRVPAKECTGVHLAAYQRALTGLAEVIRLESKGDLRSLDQPPSLDELAPAVAMNPEGNGRESSSESSSESDSSSESGSENNSDSESELE